MNFLISKAILILITLILGSGAVFPAYAQNVSTSQTLIDNRRETNAELKELRELFLTQKEIIRDLQSEKTRIGIMLNSVAILVTTLGVGIALFSIIGYQQLINKGVKEAAKEAESVVSKLSKEEFQKFIRNGELTDLIKDIINQISYRGVTHDNDENHNISESEEHDS